MIIFSKFLIEKRKNPSRNPKISAYESLLKYKDDPDIYISFTDIKKVGIKPLSDFNTPLGVYTYPLKEIWPKIEQDKDSSHIPFAGDRPFIHVLRSKNKKIFIKNLSTDYQYIEYKNDIVKLEEIYKYDLEKLNIVIEREESKAYTNAETFWNITNSLTGNTKAWNILLRKLGYTGMADKTSSGIIHPSEPMQAVFFSKDAFTVEELLLNKDYIKTTAINKNSHKDIPKFLKTLRRLGAFINQLPLHKPDPYVKSHFLIDITRYDFIKLIQEVYIKNPELIADLPPHTKFKVSMFLLMLKIPTKVLVKFAPVYKDFIDDGFKSYVSKMIFKYDLTVSNGNMSRFKQKEADNYLENITKLYDIMNDKF